VAEVYAANGLALRFTRTSTGKDLFKVPDFFGQFPLFQGPKPRPNYLRTVFVTARLDHLVDEVLPVVCQRCAHVLTVTNYCGFVKFTLPPALCLERLGDRIWTCEFLAVAFHGFCPGTEHEPGHHQLVEFPRPHQRQRHQPERRHKFTDRRVVFPALFSMNNKDVIRRR
jgi:hypothetical protein